MWAGNQVRFEPKRVKVTVASCLHMVVLHVLGTGIKLIYTADPILQNISYEANSFETSILPSRTFRDQAANSAPWRQGGLYSLFAKAYLPSYSICLQFSKSHFAIQHWDPKQEDFSDIVSLLEHCDLKHYHIAGDLWEIINPL